MTKRIFKLRKVVAGAICLAVMMMFVSCGDKEKGDYTVKYSPGTHSSGQNYSQFKSKGESITLRDATYTRNGFTQTGWSTKEDGSVKDYNLNGTYNADADITLYPFWVEGNIDPDDPGGGGKSITITGLAANGDYIEVFLYSTYPAAPFAGGGSQGTSTVQSGKGTVNLKELTPPGNPWNGSGTFVVQLLLWKPGAMDSYADLWYTGGGNISFTNFLKKPPMYSITMDNTEIGFGEFGELTE